MPGSLPSSVTITLRNTELGGPESECSRLCREQAWVHLEPWGWRR
jgi:hypothetical protein